MVDFIIVNTKEGVQPLLGSPTLQGLNLLAKVGVIDSNPDLFEGLGEIKMKPYKIKLRKNTRGVVSFSHRVPFNLMDPLKEQLEAMIQDGVITKVSEPTEWVNPIILVRKPDKSIRICLDPRNLNKAILREHYEMPSFDEITAKFKGAKIFSTLDANMGFYMVKLDEDSSKLTTFITPFGRYRFLRLPFGISSAPEIFQKVMNEIFGDIEGVAIFVDDLVIYAEDQVTHDKILKQVLQRAQERGVRFNKVKCKFNLSEIKFLGHIISSEGLKPDPDKVLAIKNMREPKNETELHTFLGLITYVGKFVKNLSEKTHPLRELIKKDVAFVWTAEHSKIFSELKDMISMDTILSFYDPQKELTLSVDCSKHSMGATLMQNGKPIAYASKALSGAELGYAQIEKEALAILFGCERYHQYVFGRVINIETDHKPLISIFKKPLDKMSPRIQRIRIRLLNYDFNLYYTPGSELLVADCMSRNVEPSDDFDFPGLGVHVVESYEINVLDKIIQSQVELLYEKEKIVDLQLVHDEMQNDSQMQLLIEMIQNGWAEQKNKVPDPIKVFFPYRDELTVIGGLIYKGDQMLIPKTLRRLVLERLHYPHLGVVKTKYRARDFCFWPQINQQIEDFVLSCDVCQHHVNQNPKETFLNREMPTRAWQNLGSDLFHFDGKDFLLAVDYFSKYPEIVQLQRIDSASIILALKSIFARHGIPEKLYSDNGKQYDSAECKAFAKTWGFENITSSPEYPQSNGFIEKAIQTVKKMLKKCLEDNKDPYLALL